MSKLYIFLGDLTPDRTLATNKREAWMPKDGNGYFDKSANRYFGSRREKRAWLARTGMREADLYRPAHAPPNGRMTKRGTGG